MNRLMTRARYTAGNHNGGVWWGWGGFQIEDVAPERARLAGARAWQTEEIVKPVVGSPLRLTIFWEMNAERRRNDKSKVII